MARPFRIEIAGALYHLTARGNAHQEIFLDDDDCYDFLDLLTRACDRYHRHCYTYLPGRALYLAAGG